MLYIQVLIRLHVVPVSIISYRGVQFIAQFWKTFQRSLSLKVNLSTAFHAHNDGKAERIIQKLEHMLRACVIDFKGNRNDHSPLIKIRYNNSYTLASKWLLMKLFMGEYAYIILDGLKLVKLGW